MKTSIEKLYFFISGKQKLMDTYDTIFMIPTKGGGNTGVREFADER